ncbi:MAG: hypothetical protein JKY56_02830 [Kofleriaceae bacterium]|nr:hypothetical protein [Kofleriaceae bacterium]
MQTEDSGVGNPHLFTHLFHGGVILSSRRMDYDPDSEEDMVKTLMQSQHTAVAKDLKLGTFDDKIDSYLGTNPELLPRKGGAAKAPIAAKAEDTAPTQSDATIRAATDEDPTPKVEETVRVEAEVTPTQEEKEEEVVRVEAEAPTPTDNAPSVFTADVEDTDTTATTQISRDAAGELFGHDTQELSEIAEKVTRNHNQKVATEKADIARKSEELAKQRELHAEEMFAHARAEISSEVEVGVASNDSERLHVEERAPQLLDERAPEPVLESTHSGSYAIIRPPQGAPAEAVKKEPSRPVKQQRQQTKKSTRPAVTPPRQRQPTGKQQPPTSRQRASTAQQVSSERTAGKPPRAATSRRRSSVVVSRPAVIIGAPPTVIGGERPRRSSARKARSNLFGKDLISEKSLDEVIMAYLSEDGNEEE